MNLSVNYEELKKLSTYVETKYRELDKKFTEIISLLDEVEKNWSGNDSTIFLVKSRYYLEKERTDNEKVKDIATILEKVAGKYEYNDKLFDEQIKKESVTDEQSIHG
jgi:uncharacterized protein YukE